MKTIIIFSFSLLQIVSIAQPVLTGPNTNLQIGESITGHQVNYTSPGSSGASQTWDFSSVSSLGTSTFTTVDPATTANAATFTAASVATLQSSTYNYYSGSASALSIEGYVYSSGLVIPFSNPEQELSYPFSYASTFTDAFGGTYINGSTTIIRKGNITVTADGYGTLLLPTGTFNNVLRVLSVEDYADSTSTGAPYSQATTTAYSWYLPNIHCPILSFTSISFNGGPPVAQFGSYLDALSTDININSVSKNPIIVSPNPFNSSATLRLNSTTILKNAELKLYDVTGKKVIDMPVERNEITISRNGLENGIYFYSFINADQIPETGRLIID
jgi:hypothetical protein